MCGSSYEVPALQVRSLEFKLQTHQKKPKNGSGRPTSGINSQLQFPEYYQDSNLPHQKKQKTVLCQTVKLDFGYIKPEPAQDCQFPEYLPKVFA
jgi:hypothetical protein